jgi:hypothetical protein
MRSPCSNILHVSSGYPYEVVQIAGAEVPEQKCRSRSAGAEVIADFPEPWTICEEIVRIDYPADLRVKRDDATLLVAYKRRERSTIEAPRTTETG